MPGQSNAARAHRLRQSLAGLPLLPLTIIGLLVVAALAAPILAPYSYVQGSLPDQLKPPFWEQGGSTQFLLGTDRLGRDILSRLTYGARIALIVSVAAILIGGTLGTLLGILAGYVGGWVDTIVTILVDLSMALPVILLALVLAIVLGPSLFNVIAIISALIWARYARQVRGEVLSVREKDFVRLAQLAGCSTWRIIFRHIFPNVVNSLIVLATLQVGWLILLEGSLSFLGVGVPSPEPSWGSMVADGRELIVTGWWISAIPGAAMLLVVLAMNMLGDWLRDALDPKLVQSAGDNGQGAEDESEPQMAAVSA